MSINENEQGVTGKDRIQQATMDDSDVKGSIDAKIDMNSYPDDSDSSKIDKDQEDELYTKKELEKAKDFSYKAGQQKYPKALARKLGLESEITEEDIIQWYEKTQEYEEHQTKNKTHEQIELSSLGKQNKKLSETVETLNRERNLLVYYISENALQQAVEKEASALGAVRPQDIANDKRVFDRLTIDTEKFIQNLSNHDKSVPIIDRVTGDEIRLSRILEAYKKENPHHFNSVRSSGSGYPNRPSYEPGQKQLVGRDRILNAKD